MPVAAYRQSHKQKQPKTMSAVNEHTSQPGQPCAARDRPGRSLMPNCFETCQNFNFCTFFFFCGLCSCNISDSDNENDQLCMLSLKHKKKPEMWKRNKVKQKWKLDIHKPSQQATSGSSCLRTTISSSCLRTTISMSYPDKLAWNIDRKFSQTFDLLRIQLPLKYIDGVLPKMDKLNKVITLFQFILFEFVVFNDELN